MRQTLICLILIGVALSVLIGCSVPVPGPAETPSPILGIDEPLLVGDVMVTVDEARLRDNYQTHYIMTHAPPEHIFYEVILSIEGAGDALEWGEKNLSLVYDGKQQELELARWIVVGEDVEYKAGEDYTYRYVYIYQAPRQSEFSKYRLESSAGQTIELASILETNVVANPKEPENGEGSMVAGGMDNLASGDYAVVSGGSANTASAYFAVVGGGNMNAASASHTFVGGGRENAADGFYSTVCGGYANMASGRDATVAGGSRNTASNTHAAVGGGIQNSASSSDTTIAGGANNTASDNYATVAGGTRNTASGYSAVICGGSGNTASDSHAVVGGGLGNQALGIYSTVGGGYSNQTGGSYATVPGGSFNQAGGDYSFAAGYRARVNSAHNGTTLFADASDADFFSQAANEFAVRAIGGVRFVSAVDEGGDPISGVSLAPGSGSWSSLSDRAMKANLAPVDGVEVLGLVSSLPLSTWNYTSQDPSVRHIGPMAGDFHATFGLGEDRQHISTVDADGVAFAAIQGLYHLVQEQDVQITAQQREIDDLEARVRMLEQSLQGRARPGEASLSSAWVVISLLLVLCVMGLPTFTKVANLRRG